MLNSLTRDYISDLEIEKNRILEDLSRKDQLIEMSDVVISAKPSETGTPFLIIPGAFYTEYPGHNADGSMIARKIQNLGYPATVLDYPSFCSCEEGALIVYRYLQQYTGSKINLVTISKSTLDVRYMLSCFDVEKIQEKIASWTTISGLYNGTHVVREILEKRLRRFFISCIFKVRKYSLTSLYDLGKVEFYETMKLPPYIYILPLFHVIAFPDYSKLSSRLSRRSVLLMSRHGASDGGGILLKSTLKLPGKIVPVRNADHYLKGVSMERIFSAITNYLKSSIC
jgi:hypothetical protein